LQAVSDVSYAAERTVFSKHFVLARGFPVKEVAHDSNIYVPHKEDNGKRACQQLGHLACQAGYTETKPCMLVLTSFIYQISTKGIAKAMKAIAVGRVRNKGKVCSLS
jgi:hypothetical protein